MCKISWRQMSCWKSGGLERVHYVYETLSGSQLSINFDEWWRNQWRTTFNLGAECHYFYSASWLWLGSGPVFTEGRSSQIFNFKRWVRFHVQWNYLPSDYRTRNCIRYGTEGDPVQTITESIFNSNFSYHYQKVNSRNLFCRILSSNLRNVKK